MTEHEETFEHFEHDQEEDRRRVNHDGHWKTRSKSRYMLSSCRPISRDCKPKTSTYRPKLQETDHAPSTQDLT